MSDYHGLAVGLDDAEEFTCHYCDFEGSQNVCSDSFLIGKLKTKNHSDFVLLPTDLVESFYGDVKQYDPKKGMFGIKQLQKKYIVTSATPIV